MPFNFGTMIVNTIILPLQRRRHDAKMKQAMGWTKEDEAKLSRLPHEDEDDLDWSEGALRRDQEAVDAVRANRANRAEAVVAIKAMADKGKVLRDSARAAARAREDAGIDVYAPKNRMMLIQSLFAHGSAHTESEARRLDKILSDRIAEYVEMFSEGRINSVELIQKLVWEGTNEFTVDELAPPEDGE